MTEDSENLLRFDETYERMFVCTYEHMYVRMRWKEQVPGLATRTCDPSLSYHVSVSTVLCVVKNVHREGSSEYTVYIRDTFTIRPYNDMEIQW